MRGRSGRAGAGGPGTPDSTGARPPEAGAGGLPFRVRPPRRPEPSDIAAHDPVILSDYDVAVIQKALAAARRDSNDDRQDAAAGQHGIGPGPGSPAEEPRETSPPEARYSAPPPAITRALPAANPSPPWGKVLGNTIRLWAQHRLWRDESVPEAVAVRRLNANRTRQRRRLLLYALAAASIVVAAALVDHWGVLPRVDANTSSSPTQVGGPAQRSQLLPPLDQPPVMHFSNAVDVTSTPAESSAPTGPAAEPSGAQNPAARPAGSPTPAESPRSATGESSGGGPSTIARGG
jgi:hypothetical protein